MKYSTKGEELPFHEIIRKMVSAEIQIDFLKKRGRYEKRIEKKECRVCCGKRCGECKGFCKREIGLCTGSCYYARQRFWEKYPYYEPKEEKRVRGKRKSLVNTNPSLNNK